MGIEVYHTKELRQLCIKIIARNFERFMDTFESGNYELHYLFELLLQRERRTSISLLKKILRTDKFQKYMDFLLHPYIKEVDFYFVEVADATPIIERLKQIAPTITTLGLPWSDYENTCLPELVSLLTEVETLSLRGIKISTETFSCIGKNCRNLKSLTVHCKDMTDLHIRALVPNNSDNKCNLGESLEYLYFKNINEVGLKYAFKHFRGLLHFDNQSMLYLYVCDLHENDVHNDARMTEIYKLQKLDIEFIGNRSTKFLKFCGKLFPHLETLSIGYVTYQIYIDALKALPSLKEFKLRAHESCNLSSYLQEKGRELKKLEIMDGGISLNSLLNSCPKINSLKLMYPTIINDTLTSKCSLNYCSDLQLVFCLGDYLNNDLNKQFIKCLLSRCPNLENLSLYNSSDDANRGFDINYIKLITGSGKWIRSLRRLDCPFAKMEMSALQYFVENASNLEVLLLGKDRLTWLRKMPLSLIMPLFHVPTVAFQMVAS